MSIKLKSRRVYYTPKEFAVAAKVSLTTVYRYCDQGRLFKVQPGGPHHRFLVYALEVRIPRQVADGEGGWRLAVVGPAQVGAAQRGKPLAGQRK